MQIINRAKDIFSELRLYWRQPRPGEYVSYREIVLLSLGWMALCMSVRWTITFAVGNEFTGMTLKMTNNQLLVMSYVCQAIGYIITPLNAYIVDNLRSKDGKYRVYIKLAIPSMIATLVSLWLPYERVRDADRPFAPYLMIIMLFVAGQVQSYIQGWFNTGLTNMVHVITPNTYERTKIMSITGIIYSMGHTICNLYFPIMVDVLCKNGDKYHLSYYRGAYTPVTLLAPIVLLAYYSTRERLVLPKSRITQISFLNSLRTVAGNKIFWIKCADGWNDFLEGAKGSVWDWLVYRAHIMKSSTYGLLNTIAYNGSFWAMLLSPWLIKKFGKRKIKIWKNAMQVVLIAAVGLLLESKYVAPLLFIVNAINRFIDCGEVIDKAIESDMRDNQQYLTGERIDGAFNFVQSYATGIIGAATGLFVPWVYRKKGFDGTDYSVLDVYTNFNENLPLSQQTKNPDCVLYPMLKTLITISTVGAAIDVLPWFLYDISETGQKAMIRVIRIRAMVEDRCAQMTDESQYIEGCEAIFNARKYYGKEQVELPHEELKKAKSLPAATKEEKKLRYDEIKRAKQLIQSAQECNEEIEIADFVMRELTRFETQFGKQQLELARVMAAGGEQHFFDNAHTAQQLASQLPLTDINEQRKWRRQDIRAAKQMQSSRRLAAKHYPNGIVPFAPETYEQAYDMPDDTREQAKLRRKAMKKASRERNIYGSVASPYISAVRTLELADGYAQLDDITADYDTAIEKRDERLAAEQAEAKRLALQRKDDAERRKAQRKIGK